MALKGNQKKLDKNQNNRIDAQDFKILKAEKAKGRGMGLQDEKVKPGKVMEAKRGMFSKSPNSGVKLPKKGSRLIFSGYSKPFEGPQHKGRVAAIVGVKPRAKIIGQRKKFKSMDEMRKAKGFKPGETAAQFNKRKAAAEFAKKAASATGAKGKIALGVAAAGVGAVQYLKSKMKKKDEPKKKMGGGMMQRPMGYDRGGMYLSDEKIKKVFPEKDAKRRANISQLVGGDRVSPMKKERFTAGQSARRRGLLKKIGREVAKATPLGLGIKVGEVAKKLKDKVKKRAEGGPAATASRPIPKAAQRRKMGTSPKQSIKEKKRKDLNLIVTKGGIYSYTKPEVDEKKGRHYRQHKSYDASPRLISDAKGQTMSMRSMNVGGMMKPMGYKSGKSIKAKCKLGKNKPTKMY